MEKLAALFMDLELGPRDASGYTPLHIAARNVNIEVAKILVRRNYNLLYLHSDIGVFPIHCAIRDHPKSKEAFLYFLGHTRDDEYGQPNPYAGPTGVSILVNLIMTKFYDLALQLVVRYPDLGHHKRLGNDVSALDAINIFHIAVMNRSENVFNLVCGTSLLRTNSMDSLDTNYNSVLHLAGKLAPSNKLNLVSGAALQMQRELQWFKEVKKLTPSNLLSVRNKDGKTPSMVFTEEHEKLKEAGEKWMKDTANSCTIAAALIVTVVFAAAITVPGGNSAENGLPIFSNNNAFTIFAISNAASLFTSATSLLVFLSILTSRYAEEDFLYALPNRLIIGLFTLFLSIIFMMIAFSATVYLVFGQNRRGVLIIVAAFACLPVTSFVLLQFPLLVDLVSSTYGRGIFDQRGFPQLPY
nr:ankyrin repeat-containing protein NPR4-like [Ipomoea batatas]